ncbi:hypothetical protein CK556_02980 [Mesoplasma chauliocola]|uniref:DUF3196 domain-containing protein n=1 Tax=Mesoplasma chauliocola TaxID=216427 RepID=A0A249SNW5_9MOLU|nr:hypothetical protein [Mesoplasma chauliocola]ASZ09293.1 hypothetical protein CK556_02980 [Mesoplasma chauliocola]
MNFYDELIIEIKEFISEHDFDNALLKINQELTMPYVPSDIEEKLTKFKVEIYEKISTKANINNSVNAEYILQLLKSSDREQQAFGINYLNKINLREHVEEISAILKLENIDNSIKTLILFTLKEQEINKEFDVLYSGAQITWKPIEIDFESNFKFITEIDELITKSIENENPGIAYDAKMLNINFYLNNLDIFKPENKNEKAAAFILYAIEMLDEIRNFSYLKQWFNFNEELAAKILMEIKNYE